MMLNPFFGNKLQVFIKFKFLNFQNLQAIKFASIKVSQYQLKRPKDYYFFIENEFICQSDCNLLQNEYSIKYFTTVNLIKLSRDLDPVVYKIYFDTSAFGLCNSDMKKLYKQIGQYIKDKVVLKSDSVFIGCVRDDNETHTFCTEKILKFKCRTDPIHDIFNILKNIYVTSNNSYQILNYKSGNDSVSFCYKDLQAFLDKHGTSSLPKVGYFNTKKVNKLDNQKRIWMPNRNIQLEKFIIPFRRLFNINYYLKIYNLLQQNQDDVRKHKEAHLLVNLIMILQNIYEMQHRFFTREDIQNLENHLCELRHYKFLNNNIRCLENLKMSTKTNLETFKTLKAGTIKFKPSYFSTQIVEAEKGYLRYINCGDLPTESQCICWFKHVQAGTDNMELSSEFGRIKVKFEKLHASKFEFKRTEIYGISSKISGNIYELFWSYSD